MYFFIPFMFRFSLNEDKAADLIDQAIKQVLASGIRTKDIAKFDAKQVVTTSQMGDAICSFL